MGKPWYHWGITREVAERRLKAVPSDSFLLRNSQRGEGCFSLSLTHQGDIRHFLMEKNLLSGKYELQGTGMSFPSLTALVDYYKLHPISEGGEMLRIPCSRKLVSGILFQVTHALNVMTQLLNFIQRYEIITAF